MKNSLVFLFLVIKFTGFAQLKNTGFYGKNHVPSAKEGMAALDDQKVTDLVTEMLDKLGLENRYIIIATAGIPNCEAMIDDSHRPCILYNSAFLEHVKFLNFTNATLPKTTITDQDWMILTILAHELGHHLNQHLTNPPQGMSELEMELEADKFAGRMVHLLGATLAQALAVMYDPAVPLEPSFTHPGRADRLAAIKKGWNKVKTEPDIPKYVPNTVPVSIVSNRDDPNIQPKMVTVHGGGGNMGMTGGSKNAGRQIIVKDFEMCKYLITQAQWNDIMGTNPSENKGCDNCPVEQVSWNEVQEFIFKLNMKTGKTYRLPTEAEYEYAARGGINHEKFIYSGSNDLNKVGWYSGNSGYSTHPVGQKAPNRLGIYDMSGNVWEWCDDRYYSNFHSYENVGNPRVMYIIRGGSWSGSASSARVWDHSYESKDFRRSGLGFRLVSSL